MRMPHLEIKTTNGKIGIQSKAAKLSIHPQKADLQIRQPKAEMKIHVKPGKLLIDQSKAFSEEHLKPVSELIADYAKRGKQAVLQGIARKVQEGDALMNIQNGGHPIADIAKRDSTDPQLEYNIGWIPNSVFDVKIHYIPSKLSIQWSIHKPIIKATPHHPQYKYSPGTVDVYMKQWPSIHIKEVGGKYDQNI